MIHYIIASHKNLASGFSSALQTIVGTVDTLHVINAYLSNEDLSHLIDVTLKQIPVEDSLIVMTDIYGGSVNTEFMKYLDKRDFHLISGVNLALMIAIIVEIPKEVTREKIIEKIDESRNAIRYCNDDLLNEIVEEEF